VDLFYTATNLWLQAIHLLRKTLVWHDGWNGLFDEDSDFSDKGFRKGLYNFWESKDVFLDSALVCNMLLNNVEIHETPAKTEQKEKIWEDIAPYMRNAIEDYWVESKALKSKGKRLLIKKFCKTRGLDATTFKSEKDRVEKRRTRLE
jgi:hypothetical protein